MTIKMSVTSLCLVMIGITCFFHHQVTAILAEEDCKQQTNKINLNLVQAVKDNRRDLFRRNCEAFRYLIEQCVKSYFSSTSIKLDYEESCLNEESQKWLKSRGTSVRGGLLTGTLTILAVMSRLYIK